MSTEKDESENLEEDYNFLLKKCLKMKITLESVQYFLEYIERLRKNHQEIKSNDLKNSEKVLKCVRDALDF